MRNLRGLSAVALALVVGSVAVPALADDPNDPTMQSSQARARDRAEIRRLNNEQLAYVRDRDAGYAQGWREYADANGRGSSRSASNSRSAQREYEQALADWRADVAACRAGYYDRCAQR